MNVELALRYYPVVEVLRQKRVTKVLEVGSGINGISDFFKGQVVGVDVNFSRLSGAKNPNITHKVGSITKIPVADSSINFVICIDTLEHLPPSWRKKGLQELLRVTKSGGTVIIGFPSGYLSLQAEKIINSLYRLVQKRDHPWLAEHFVSGLPSLQATIRELRELGGNRVKVTGNVNLLVWMVIHLIFTLWDGKINLNRLTFLDQPLFSLGKFLQVGPFYRQILVIEK